MTTATLELYDALIEAGISKDAAKAAAEAVLTKKEAADLLLTKVEFHKALNAQAFMIIGAVGVMITLMTLIVSLL